MKYEKHALKQMAKRGITFLDVAAATANPTKTAPGHSGRTNVWGLGTQYRIRVTLNRDGSVKTVAWADARKQK